MIEVRRDLYMDENTGLKNDNFNELKNKIKKILNDLDELKI